MWSTPGYWLDLAVYLGLTAVGTICFGRFEDWKPRWKRLLKVGLFTGFFIGLLSVGGRPLAWGVMGSLLLVVIYIHAFWLPKHGINGWTAEPRDKYLELVGARKTG